MISLGIYGFFGFLAVVGFFLSLYIIRLRRVVPTNEVHIVQTRGSTKSYGKDMGNGNVYYEWPSFLPILGVQVVALPLSIFNVNLEDYEGMDSGRLPFSLDVMGFYRIVDPAMAAQRVSTFKGLIEQLQSITQGAVRKVLTGMDLETIIGTRGTLGEEFTKEVTEQLKEWGVQPVNTLELMEIRDSKGSSVIQQITSKKLSVIDMESRSAIAENRKKAEIAEQESAREINLKKQAVAQEVGLRTVEQEKAVALAKEQQKQELSERQKLTAEKQMEVARVQELRAAEINKEVELVKAEQEKRKTILAAEASFEAARQEAEGTTLAGKAKAEAEKAFLLAPVEAQTTLAKEIGSNKSYQEYLISIRKVEAEQAVGMKQAEALQKAQIKIIANSGDASSGLSSVTDVLSSKGGTAIGAMLEGFANTDAGKETLKKLGVDFSGDTKVN
jgi:flotillin